MLPVISQGSHGAGAFLFSKVACDAYTEYGQAGLTHVFIYKVFFTREWSAHVTDVWWSVSGLP